jgi:predicted Zn-dependent peptidase
MSIELSRRAWGPMLGRHATGTPETLAAIGRDDLAQWYDTHFAAAGMQVTAAGAFDPDALQAELERLFEGFGNERPPAEAPEPTFAAGRHHIPKDCEQEALGISFGSLPPDDEDSYAEAVLLEILSGGMSGRLFTEVREKRGLAYWVFASRHWRRGHGRFRLAAGTRPERVHETLEVLLNEVGRLRDDVTEEELARAKTGLIAQMATRGDSTRSRAATIGMGYFYRGRVMSEDERRKRIEAVTTADVRRVLDRQNRDELCILTLGPRELD